MTDVEGTSYGTTVGIPSIIGENLCKHLQRSTSFVSRIRDCLLIDRSVRLFSRWIHRKTLDLIIGWDERQARWKLFLYRQCPSTRVALIVTYSNRAENCQRSRHRRSWSLSSVEPWVRWNSLGFRSLLRNTNSRVNGISVRRKPAHRSRRVARLQGVSRLRSRSRETSRSRSTNSTFLTAPSFVGSVGTIDAPVAEVRSRKARTIPASQFLSIALTVLEQRPRWSGVYEKLWKFRITVRREDAFLWIFSSTRDIW